MQTLDFARVAAAAEMLLLKRMVRRQVMRAVFGAIAAMFLIGTLALLHVVGYQALRLVLTPILAATVVLAVDFVFAVIFAVLAMQNSPGAVEGEAKLLRDQAADGIKESLALSALISPVGKLAVRMVGRKRVTGLTLAALAAKLLAGDRRYPRKT